MGNGTARVELPRRAKAELGVIVGVQGYAMLAEEMDGPVFRPGDEGYDDEVGGFNLAVRHGPSIVAGVASATDVSKAVRYAARDGMPVGVQATGHGARAPVRDGMLISTRRLDALEVDPAARTATIGAGVRWGQVVAAAAPLGLAPLNGSAPSVGAVGYTLGGGLPVLGRTHGFGADHVRALEVITADGVIRRVDAGNEPELFWALRGGGTLGVVTSMRVGLVSPGSLYAGGIFYPGTAAAEVLHAYRRWCPGLPESVTTSIALLRFPPAPQLPEPLRGQFLVHLRFVCVAGEAAGAELLEPMREVAPVVIDEVRPMDYADIGSVYHDPDSPVPFSASATTIDELSEPVVDALLDLVGPGSDTPLLLTEVRQLGGALARAPAIPDAIGIRDAGYLVASVGALRPEVADAVTRAVDEVPRAVGRYGSGLGFSNFDTATDGVRYWPPDIESRLRGIKAAYDPGDMFGRGHATVIAPG